MNPAAEAAVRESLDDWRREAHGSRSMAELYDRRAVAVEEEAVEASKRIFEGAERDAEQYRAEAAEHRRDAERAETRVLELEQALRDEGVDPDQKRIGS